MQKSKKPNKIAISLRLEAWMLDAIKATGIPVTAAIEEGVALWLQKRKQSEEKNPKS